MEGFECEVNEDYLVSLGIADGNVFKAEKIYKEWDIVKVYEVDAYKKAINYTPFEPPKSK